MRNIAVVTGTRAEYGLLQPVLNAIRTRNDLELLLVVTGMHLSREFGHTVDDIEKDGFDISASVQMLAENDTLEAMAESIGKGVIGMAQAWDRLKPDAVLVLGDRVEPLAAAIAAAYMNIPVGHIHGGDSPRSGLDEYARHAITKLSHIHFPATRKSARRIIRMGEDEWRVHVVGSPALDSILNEKLLSATELADKLKLDLSVPPVLVVQHPVTTQVAAAPAQIRQTLEAVVEMERPTVVVYPNSDAGGRRIIEVIKEYEDRPLIKTFTSLPHLEYLSLMKAAAMIVGNSSSGIIEAPSFGVPAVNVGMRQEGRERGDNVIDVAHDRREITEAMRKALTDQRFLATVKKRRSPYGDGKAGERIARIMKEAEATPELMQKKIAY